MGGIIQAIFIENQSARQRTDFKQAVPINGVAGHTRHFKPHYYSSFAKSNIGDQFLKSLPIRS